MPTADCGGLGDRVRGIITAAAYALATQRAFFIDWPLSQDIITAAEGVTMSLPDHVWSALRVLNPVSAQGTVCGSTKFITQVLCERCIQSLLFY